MLAWIVWRMLYKCAQMRKIMAMKRNQVKKRNQRAAHVQINQKQRQRPKVLQKRFPKRRVPPRKSLTRRQPQNLRVRGSSMLWYLILWKENTEMVAPNVDTEKGVHPRVGLWEDTFSSVNSFLVATDVQLFSQLRSCLQICRETIHASEKYSL